MDTDQNFFKKNGYLLKKNLINKKTIDKINKVVNEVVAKDKQKNKQKVTNGTQSYDNYHFVYSSNSSKNKEILRLNNPQNRHKIFYELSRNKKIISIVKKLIGGSVRFHLGKLNFKLPNKKKGSEVAWHQDWAFYPHTNDDLVTVGIYLNDCTEKNGPLKIIKNSHTKKYITIIVMKIFLLEKLIQKRTKLELIIVYQLQEQLEQLFSFTADLFMDLVAIK